MKNEMLRNLFVEMTKGAESLVNVTVEDVDEFMDESDAVGGKCVKGSMNGVGNLLAKCVLELMEEKELSKANRLMFVVKSGNMGGLTLEDLNGCMERANEVMQMGYCVWGMVGDELMDRDEVELFVMVGRGACR